jgi:hypothetical protein
VTARLAAAFVLALASCSSNGDSTAGPQTEADVAEAVAAYTDAFARGDGDAAWALVSERCRGEVPEVEHRATVAAAAELYPAMRAQEISADVAGDRATVDYRVTDLDETYTAQRWALEADGWLWDDC